MNKDKIVYSTEHGRMCPGCGEAADECVCTKGQAAGAAAGDGIVRLSRQTKGRKGKGVTIVSGVPVGGDELKKLAKELKSKCGCGGTVKEGVIEIQGEKREQVMEILQGKGWTVKISGG